MTDTVTTSATMRQEFRTSELRFIERGGKRILQQAFVITIVDEGGRHKGHGGIEWRDIPLVTDGNAG